MIKEIKIIGLDFVKIEAINLMKAKQREVKIYEEEVEIRRQELEQRKKETRLIESLVDLLKEKERGD